MALLLMCQVMKYDETSRNCAASRWCTAAEDIECQLAIRILQDAELLLKPRLLLLEFDASACPRGGVGARQSLECTLLCAGHLTSMQLCR